MTIAVNFYDNASNELLDGRNLDHVPRVGDDVAFIVGATQRVVSVTWLVDVPSVAVRLADLP